MRRIRRRSGSPPRFPFSRSTSRSLTLPLLSLLLSACVNPPQPQATPTPPTASAPGQAFELHASSAVNPQGLDRVTVTVKGGQGAVSGLLHLELPAQARIVGAELQDGLVQVEGHHVLLISRTANPTLQLDIEGLKGGDLISAKLLDAAASNGILNAPVKVDFKAATGPTEFTAAPGIDQAAQVRALATLRAQTTSRTYTVPSVPRRQWLAQELGDVDADGAVTLKDSTLLTEALLNLNNRTLNDAQRFQADFLDDLTVDFSDLALLAGKILGERRGISTSLAAAHPKTLLLSDTQQLLVIRNAGAGNNSLLTTPSAPWIKLNRVQSGIHPRTHAYEVTRASGTPAGSTAIIDIQGGLKPRAVKVALLPDVNTTPATETYAIQPGQTITGLDGVQVTAPAAWRDPAITRATITIERIDPRTLAVPLDSDLRIGLPIYRVQADAPLITSDAGRFHIRIPVGAVNAEYLYPLTLDRVNVDREESDTPIEELVWTGDSQALVTPQAITFQVTGLTDDTHLFTAALLDEPRPATASVKAQAFADPITAVCETVLGTNSAGQKQNLTFPCTPAAKTNAVAWMKTHLSEFTSIFSFTDADWASVLTPQVFLVPSAMSGWTYSDLCTKLGWRGYYSPGRSRMAVCTTVNTGDLPNPSFTYTVRHELMHAVQYRMKAWTGKDSGKDWITEGTARASEGSNGTSMGLSPREDEPVLRLDQPLNTLNSGGQRTYAHQDFWVYLGRRAGQGLNYLRPFFEQGIPSPRAGVNSAIQGNAALVAANMGTLGKAYWAFAKNQAIEHSVALRGSDTACTINTVASSSALVPSAATLDFRTLKDQPQAGSLAPLQSIAFEYTLSGVKPDGEKTMYALASKTVNDANDIKVAVYVRKDGSYTCPGVELTPGALQDLKVKNGSKVFILVSNLSFSTDRNFKVQVGKAKLEELEPQTVSTDLDVGKDKAEPYSFKNTGLAPLEYEIKLEPQGTAGAFTTVTVTRPALTGTVAAATLKTDETADPKKQDGELKITCSKATTSAVQWKVKFFDRAVDGSAPQAEMTVTVNCKDLRPPVVQQTGSGEEVSTSGNECETTTTYRPWATYSVTAPSGLSPDVKITALTDNQGKSTSRAPWALTGKLYSGTHSVVGTLRTETSVSSSEPLTITVPPVRTETKKHDCGGNAGDPHLMTIDGQRYSFQGVGEYVFTRTPDRAFEVQMRFHQMGEQGSANSAIAMNVAGDRVGLYALGLSNAGGMAMMRLNGADIPITFNSIQTLPLPKGGRVEVTSGRVKIVWPDSNFVSLRWNSEFFDFVTVGVLPEYRGRLEGLLGNDNRDVRDEYRGRDGTLYPNPPSFEQLYRGFGESWRIRQDESLFDYAPGQNTSTFTKLNFPPPPVPFTPEQTAQAASTCRAAGVTTAEILQNCIFDVSNNPAAAQPLAQASAFADPARPTATVSPAWAEAGPGTQVLLGAVVTGDAQATEVTWQADQGVIAPRGDGTALFTAPDTAGPVRITATLRGQASYAQVEVRSGLIEAPAQLKLFEEQSSPVNVRLIGAPAGVALKWAAVRGQVTGSGTSVTYAAPATAGTDELTIEVDGRPDTRVVIPVQVLTPTIQISPQNLTLYTGDTTGLNALLAGFSVGQAIQWTATGGTLNAGLGAAVFTAPATPGEYTVTAVVASRPSITSTARITVLKVDPVASLQMNSSVHAGETVTVRALNMDGSPYRMSPLQWQATGGTLNVVDASTATFTAGTAPGAFTVTATPTRLPDTPTLTDVSVFIEKPVLRFASGAAASAIVPVGEQVVLSATRSTGAPYPLDLDWTATGGTVTANGNAAIFQAGTVIGIYQLTAAPRQAPEYRTDLPLRVVQRITGETRFILTWGATPSDLDTHLWLPSSTPYHVYYGRRGTDSVCPFAQLDQDATSAYGPEVMRVKGLTGSAGVYSLQIHNYSRTGTFTQSQAKVEVVSTATGEVLTTVIVPAGDEPGDWWNVLTFDASSGIINVVNTVGVLAEPYRDTQSGCTVTGMSTGRTNGVTTTMAEPTPGKPIWQPGVPFR